MFEKEGLDIVIVFIFEFVSIVEYEWLVIFCECVILVYINGDDWFILFINYINGSFYELEILGVVFLFLFCVFVYYCFDLEGFFMDWGYGINKIKVIF